MTQVNVTGFGLVTVNGPLPLRLVTNNGSYDLMDADGQFAQVDFHKDGRTYCNAIFARRESAQLVVDTFNATLQAP